MTICLINAYFCKTRAVSISEIIEAYFPQVLMKRTMKAELKTFLKICNCKLQGKSIQNSDIRDDELIATLGGQDELNAEVVNMNNEIEDFDSEKDYFDENDDTEYYESENEADVY